MPWKPDAEMDARLAKNDPFREAKKKMINSFLFVDAIEGAGRVRHISTVAEPELSDGLVRLGSSIASSRTTVSPH